MKNLHENALMQEMSMKEMTDTNGGDLVTALILTAILLLYSQEAY
jgi:hypothetical protein